MKREIIISPVARIEAACAPSHWAWAEGNRAAIAAHWTAQVAEKPKTFNGRVLLVSDMAVEDGVCRATYFETDFADFIAWRNLGYPDSSIANGFAMGALQGSDGAFICGVMGADTVNEGRVYFPSGTPDLSDLRADLSVDLATSVIRELEEETGLGPGEYDILDRWIVVSHWPAIAFLRPITFAEPAAAVAQRIRANIAGQKDPELSDVRVVRGPQDIDAKAMPLYLQSYFRTVFSEA